VIIKINACKIEYQSNIKVFIWDCNKKNTHTHTKNSIGKENLKYEILKKIKLYSIVIKPDLTSQL